MANCVEKEVDITCITSFEETETIRSESDGADTQGTEITTFNSDETDGMLVMLSKSEDFVSSSGLKYHHRVKQLIALYEPAHEKQIFFVGVLRNVSILLVQSVYFQFSLILAIAN